MKELEEIELRDPEELLLMGGCPQCGLEVNEAFVKDVIDRIRTKAYELGKKEERERIEQVFKEEVPPHGLDLGDAVWLKRVLQKAFK